MCFYFFFICLVYFWEISDKIEMWTVHIRGPAQLFEAHLISSQVNACSISQCFILRVSSFANRQSGWVIHHCWHIHYPVCWTNTFVTALFFFSVPHTRVSTPNNHKLTDSGEAQLSIVFLVDSFRAFHTVYQEWLTVFFMIYSVQYMLLVFWRSTAVMYSNSDAFWLIAMFSL